MTITSKTKEGKCYSLHSDGGELGQITEAAGENGTDVSVEMLFFNTPVRLGFLKTDKGEETDITNFVSRFILNRPEISFTYYVDGKKQLQSFGGGIEEALVGIYGAATLSQCFQIDVNKHGIHIRGYIGNQNFFKANKSYQSVFLNGRFVQNLTISSAITNAYSAYAMKRQYPFYVLYIDVPTEIVDVNVHPNKADVRFADNKIIYGCIYSVISAVLDGQTKAMEYIVSQPTSAVYADEAPASSPAPVEEKTIAKKEEEKQTYTSMFDLSKKTSTKNAGGGQSAVLGIASISYEDAQREMELSAPAFTAKKQGIELPFEGREREEEPIPGFVPLDQIEDYIPSGKTKKSKKSFHRVPPFCRI